MIINSKWTLVSATAFRKGFARVPGVEREGGGSQALLTRPSSKLIVSVYSVPTRKIHMFIAKISNILSICRGNRFIRDRMGRHVPLSCEDCVRSFIDFGYVLQ
ncbi:hypothetical protein L798_04114 [Zootermopsis nevadensis]|uniref:Uncharacterized protein n=1 Tax=Zootermopsis nevadensis TaxID=136037 RepID=A0A067QIE2_ZOONE|nr:hypothetical protein L798_04114 [Zootermopsis nevadensis]